MAGIGLEYGSGDKLCSHKATLPNKVGCYINHVDVVGEVREFTLHRLLGNRADKGEQI
jgi:hypothetical protein